jgi:hypothetical protein
LSTTVTIYPSADSFVDSANATTSYGNENYLQVEDGKRAWIRFDLSGIPAGKVIISAVLSVKPFYSGYRSMNIQRCTDLTWGETTITWNNAPNASIINETLYLDGWGYADYYNFNVSGPVTEALASGGICWRIKNAQNGGYNPFCWLSEKFYTSTGCSKLVIVYSDSGTGTGWVDVPAYDAAYIDGTFIADPPPASQGYSVVHNDGLHLYNSSSSGHDVAMPYANYLTTPANLQSLGMPAGATVTGAEWRAFMNTAWGAGGGCDSYFAWSTTGTLGDTVTLDDWAFPSCSTTYIGQTWGKGTGWKYWSLATPFVNASGYTNCGIKIGAGGTLDPAQNFAAFSSPSNADGNAPVLRIYYQVEVAPSSAPERMRRGFGL